MIVMMKYNSEVVNYKLWVVVYNWQVHVIGRSEETFSDTHFLQA